MKSRTVVCLILAAAWLWACEFPAAHPTASADASQPAPTTSANPATNVAPTDGDCYHTWASRDLPAVSKSFEGALQAINPQLSGSAYAYGEDCVFADGTRTFAAMETDFRVRMHVTDLKDTAKIGDSIAEAMNVVTGIPAEDISGPEPGRVDFEFYLSETQALMLSVGIEKYRGIAPGTSGADLFKMFYTGP